MPDDAPMLCDVVARCISTGRSAAVFPICAPIAASDDFRSPPRLVVVPFRPLRAHPSHSTPLDGVSEADIHTNQTRRHGWISAGVLCDGKIINRTFV